MKKKSSPPVFKEYTQGQVVLLPTDLDTQTPLRWLEKIRTEFGLLCIAHNMAKLAVS